jgi:hypothetical protein
MKLVVLGSRFELIAENRSDQHQLNKLFDLSYEHGTEIKLYTWDGSGTRIEFAVKTP